MKLHIMSFVFLLSFIILTNNIYASSQCAGVNIDAEREAISNSELPYKMRSRSAARYSTCHINRELDDICTYKKMNNAEVLSVVDNCLENLQWWIENITYNQGIGGGIFNRGATLALSLGGLLFSSQDAKIDLMFTNIMSYPADVRDLCATPILESTIRSLETAQQDPKNACRSGNQSGCQEQSRIRYYLDIFNTVMNLLPHWNEQHPHTHKGGRI